VDINELHLNLVKLVLGMTTQLGQKSGNQPPWWCRRAAPEPFALIIDRVIRGGSVRSDETAVSRASAGGAIPQELGVGIGIDRLVDDAGDSGELHPWRDGSVGDDGRSMIEWATSVRRCRWSPASTGFCGGVPAEAAPAASRLLSSTGGTPQGPARSRDG